ncbi:Hsp20/alpha crystallin family protein [Paenibacillus sp. N1-5-1-14]|uniref:Hsp20/alpha crystallin family protein n=1 Tax=Paenibacillus radicibacter TaxID=2972488 RepID=UPI00215990D8|nr:Hsp20/alpha crystallin family protein [Paenibacillus radicibacter]MCR8641204.1 Hsp20/alpha crystallin family protein [Paenibacillus radicibacter]
MSHPNKKITNWFSNDPFFNTKFPFDKLGDQSNLDPSFVEQYVKDVLTQASNNPMQVSNHQLPYELFEMHHSVIAKLKLPKGIRPSSLVISINSSQIKIEGIGSNRDREQRIPLSIPVVPSRSTATFKQDVLQIKMPKLSKGHFVEVPIRYL